MDNVKRILRDVEANLEPLAMSDADLRLWLIENCVPPMKAEQLEYIQKARIEDVRTGFLGGVFDGAEFDYENEKNKRHQN